MAGRGLLQGRIFSVPKAGGGYRYYRSAGIFAKPAPPRPLSGLGTPVEDAAGNLPPDATYVGEGEQAHGTIARGRDWGTVAHWGLIGGLLTAMWWVLFRK